MRTRRWCRVPPVNHYLLPPHHRVEIPTDHSEGRRKSPPIHTMLHIARQIWLSRAFSLST